MSSFMRMEHLDRQMRVQRTFQNNHPADNANALIPLLDNGPVLFPDDDLSIGAFPKDAIFMGFDVLTDPSYRDYHEFMMEFYQNSAPCPEFLLLDEVAVTAFEGRSPLDPPSLPEDALAEDRVSADNELDVVDSGNLSGEKQDTRTDNGDWMRNANGPFELGLHMADNPDLANGATEKESQLWNGEAAGGIVLDSEDVEQVSIMNQHKIEASPVLEAASPSDRASSRSPALDSRLQLSHTQVAPQSLHGHQVSHPLPPLHPTVQQVLDRLIQPPEMPQGSPTPQSRPSTGNTGLSQISGSTKKQNSSSEQQSSAQLVKTQSDSSNWKENGELKMFIRVNHFDRFLRLNNRPPVPKVETKGKVSKDKSSKGKSLKEKTWFTERSSRIKALSDYDRLLFDAFIQKSMEAQARRSGERVGTAAAPINVDDDDDRDGDSAKSMRDASTGAKYRQIQPKKRTHDRYTEAIDQGEHMDRALAGPSEKKTRKDDKGMIVLQSDKRPGFVGQQMLSKRSSGSNNENIGTNSLATPHYSPSADMGGPGLGIYGLDLPSYGEQANFGGEEYQSYNGRLDVNDDYGEVGAFEEFPFKRPAW